MLTAAYDVAPRAVTSATLEIMNEGVMRVQDSDRALTHRAARHQVGLECQHQRMVTRRPGHQGGELP